MPSNASCVSDENYNKSAASKHAAHKQSRHASPMQGKHASLKQNKHAVLPMQNKKGTFITFEGGEGAGKSTQIKLLAKHLEACGYNICLVREPGATALGEKIREILLDKEQSGICAITELFLYEAARAQIVQDVIKPALNEGKVVLCDRFADSTIAYQGFGRKIDPQVIQKLNKLASSSLVPDSTILLQINPECGLERAACASASGADRIEEAGSDFHSRVYSGFEKLAQKYPQRIYKIDASQTLEQVQSQVWECVAHFFADAPAPQSSAASAASSLDEGAAPAPQLDDDTLQSQSAAGITAPQLETGASVPQHSAAASQSFANQQAPQLDDDTLQPSAKLKNHPTTKGSK